MRRYSQWFVVGVCFCMLCACSSDNDGGFMSSGNSNTTGGDDGSSSSGEVDSSGSLLDFDISWDDLSETDYTEVDETVVTDSSDEEYDDFIENSSFGSTIQIAYTDDGATVTGSVSGVTVSTSDAHVTVNSTVSGVEYVLSGSSSDGALKVYSEKKFKLTLNGVTLTNQTGAAINIQSGKRVFVNVADGTTNTLTDSDSYSTTDGEDEKACFFSEGQLIFSGTGKLNVTGNYKHAICSDDYIRLRSGVDIEVLDAESDGLHVNDYVIIGGGSLVINCTNDAIQAEAEGIDMRAGYVEITTTGEKGMGLKADDDGNGTGNVTISGGVLKVQVSGAASKAIKVDNDLSVTGGQMLLITKGSAMYDSDESDISSPAGINCDGDVTLSDAEISIKSTGSAGKGISCEGTITITDCVINVITTGSQYTHGSLDSSAKGIKAEGDLTINSGTIQVMTTGGDGSEGLESKSTLTINDGDVSVYSYDDCINVGTATTTKGIVIGGGNIYCYSSANDGMDSNGSLKISGGLIVVSGTTTPEEGIDCDQSSFSITGGTVLGIGGTTSTPTSSSTQLSVIYVGTGSADGFFSIVKSDGTHVMSYTIPRDYTSQMTILFSSSDLTKGESYTVYSDGSVSGGTSFYGLTTGGTYTEGTEATTFTISSTVTTLGTSSSSGTGGGSGGGMGGGFFGGNNRR